MVNTMAADNLASHWAIVLVPHPHPMGDSLQPIFSVQVCDIRYITHILQMKYSKLCKLYIVYAHKQMMDIRKCVLVTKFDFI